MTSLTITQDWIAHIEAKEHHFSAVAEYRESMVEYEASRSESSFKLCHRLSTTQIVRRYGLELGRLSKAQVEAKQAYDIARRGKITPTVLQDVQVRKNIF